MLLFYFIVCICFSFCLLYVNKLIFFEFFPLDSIFNIVDTIDMRDKSLINKSYGFTLIELIVVIALMGILATIGFSAYSTSMQTGRDNRRKLDLKNVATALQIYYSDNTSYPGPDGNYVALPSIIPTISPYMKQVPQDPKFASDSYIKQYVYKRMPGNCYCLGATMERSNSGEDQTGGSCIDSQYYPVTPIQSGCSDSARCYAHYTITCP
jgi:prepilin-type N-terminal cleavage/methylation domain-containing protein